MSGVGDRCVLLRVDPCGWYIFNVQLLVVMNAQLLTSLCRAAQCSK